MKGGLCGRGSVCVYDVQPATDGAAELLTVCAAGNKDEAGGTELEA